MKRVLSLFLALVMLIGMLPMQAFAVEGTSEDQNAFKGKKVSILSHSMSTYAGVSNNSAINSTIGSNDVYYTEGRHDVYLKDTWWQQTIDALDMELLVNNSWSGSCVFVPRKGEASVGYGDRAVNLHNDHTGEEPDIIFVYLGCNDFAYYKDTFGKADDVNYSTIIQENGDGTFTYATPSTTCEAYAIMLHKVANRYPDAVIYCMTSTARRETDYTGDSYPDAGQPTEYSAQLQQIAKYYGYPVIDLENAITKDVEIFDKYIGDKRAHANALGMDQITNEVLSVLLGRDAQICHVTSTDGTVQEQAVLLGSSYSAAVKLQDGYSVVVTMNGVDITQEAFTNGQIIIDDITGDIEVHTIIHRDPQNFRWELQQDALVSVGTNDNAVKKLAGTITNGVLSNSRYELTTSVVLKHDLRWEVEWQFGGNWRGCVFTSDPVQSTKDMVYLSRTVGGQLCIGTWTGEQYDNYGVDLSGLDDQVHTYRLENRISTDGNNMVWVYVDGEEIGPMNRYFIGSKDQGTTSDWICGKDFIFSYISMDGHALKDCKLNYLQGRECVHTHSYTPTVTVPTCTEQGSTTYTCECGDSYVDAYTDATGHSYENSICNSCGANKPKVPYDKLSTVWPSVNTDLTHIICYGQSFSTGSDAPYYPDATVDNVYVYGSITNSTKGTELKHLTASAGNQHPIISAGNVFAQLLTGAGIDTDIVLGSYGSGDKTIAQLMSAERQSEIKKEEGYSYEISSSGKYEIFQSSVAAMAQYAQKNDQSISCPAIVYLQGETDQNTDAQLGYPENPARAGYGAGGDKEKYKEYMSRLKEDMQREVMEQYSQTEKPLFIIYQVSGTYTRTQYSSINMAQIEFAQENEDVILVQTPYFTSHYTNSHHLTQNGYRWLGEYIGRSIYTALVEKEKPWPMLPESIEVTDSTTVRITVKGAQNGLTIDTWTVEDASNSKNLYGFYVQADGKNIVPTQVSISGNSIDLILPIELTSKSVHVYYAGKNASGTGNVRDNSTAQGFYEYLDDTNDTGTGNYQGVSHSALDANGISIIGQKYPLYNWLASFCYEVEVPEAAQKQPAFYHWEMHDAGLVSVTDGNATENKLTLVQGTVEDGMLNKVQYTMDKAIALEYDRPWVIEWKAAGNGNSYGGGKLLSNSGSNDSYAQYLYTPADSRGLVAWGVSDLSANYGFQLNKQGIDHRQEHTYRIENRIDADGVNTIYLLVDGVEIGTMNTGYRISSNTSGPAGSMIEEPYNWANGKNLYMDSIGASGSFLLSNLKMSYLKVWENGQHTHSYTPTVTAPTCTEQGYTTYTCECGDSYVDEYVNMSISKP